MTKRARDPREAEKKPPFEEPEQAAPGSESRMELKPDHGEESYHGFGRLKGRVALVTGADSGIGRAVALAFAREGADVAIAYLSEHEDAEQTRQLVEESGRAALLIPGDLADDEHCRRVVDAAVQRFGRVDVLVNNAAFQGKSVERFEDIDAARLERTFRANVMSMFHLVRYALPHMDPGGSIINTSSIQAYQPSPGILDYAATKGAIVTFTKGLAAEVIKRGVRVNAVAPGPVWTPLIAQSFSEEHMKRFGEKAPIGRPAQPKELAPAFVFLACDEGRYVNGEILGVTGGELLG
jgi:NAD(P)-dependent dehydrogenase (short-subunit alcohol dehydrogenase family)